MSLDKKKSALKLYSWICFELRAKNLLKMLWISRKLKNNFYEKFPALGLQIILN